MNFKIILIFIIIFFTKNISSKDLIYGKAKIIDGDTIHLGLDKVRFHGLDAPELKQKCTIKDQKWSCGRESKKALEKIIKKKEVRCKIIDTDQYNRFIGVCFIDNLNINKYMVRNGWAIAYRYYSLDYVEQENIAKRNKIGIWQGTFEEPYLFRKRNRK